jgi:hypothetical protein
MKTITLFTSLVLLFGTANATPFNANTNTSIDWNHFNQNEPITFTERGVAFFVFPNGDFDFNTRPEADTGGYYFRKANTKESARRSNPINYGVLIEFDYFGRVRRVGNTFINYDSRNRVSRIGSVFMRYNRFALVQIGGLHLVYNHLGEIVDYVGSVKHTGFTYNNFGNPYAQNTGYPCGNSYGYDYNDDYYYRTDRKNPTEVVNQNINSVK